MSGQSLWALSFIISYAWIAAFWDMATHKIPNFLIVIGAAAGVVVQVFLTGVSGLSSAFYGLLVGFFIFFPGYLMGFTGAGDVKLMAVFGVFLGPLGGLQSGLASIFIGGVIGLLLSVSALFVHGYISPWERYGLIVKTLCSTGRLVYISPCEGEVMRRKFPFAFSMAAGVSAWVAWQWTLA